MYRSATNPSEEFGGVDYHSYSNPDKQKLSVETARVAAEAAKPYMDAAADLYNAFIKSEATLFGIDDVSARKKYGADVFEDHIELEFLVGYARRKSEQAEANGVAGELTHNEKIMLDAYSAELDLTLAWADLDSVDDSSKYFGDIDTLERAADEAYNRSRAATDPEEIHRWRKMAKKIDEWEGFLCDDRSRYYKEFNRSAKGAGWLLQQAIVENTPDVISVNGVVAIGDVVRDTKMMREQAEMFRFFAEICSADSGRHESSSSDKTVRRKPLSPEEIARMTEQIANIPTRSGRHES